MCPLVVRLKRFYEFSIRLGEFVFLVSHPTCEVVLWCWRKSQEELSAWGNVPHPCAVSSQRPFMDNTTCPFHFFQFTSMFLLLNILACSECLYRWSLWSYSQLSVTLNSFTVVWSHFWVTEKLGNTGYLLNQEELGWRESCDKFNTEKLNT